MHKRCLRLRLCRHTLGRRRTLVRVARIDRNGFCVDASTAERGTVHFSSKLVAVISADSVAPVGVHARTRCGLARRRRVRVRNRERGRRRIHVGSGADSTRTNPRARAGHSDADALGQKHRSEATLRGRRVGRTTGG